eukprot:scaffold449_cov138-Cylindrotheca_fusiformis.AAC.13
MCNITRPARTLEERDSRLAMLLREIDSEMSESSPRDVTIPLYRYGLRSMAVETRDSVEDYDMLEDDLESITSENDEMDLCEIDWSLMLDDVDLRNDSSGDHLETDSLELEMYQNLPRIAFRSHEDDGDDVEDEGCKSLNVSYTIPLKPLESEDRPVPKKVCLPRTLRDSNGSGRVSSTKFLRPI